MKTKLLPSREERWDELKKEWKNHKIDNFEFIAFYNKLHNFLKKKPELYMFVPCDKDGNVLKKPESFEKCGRGWIGTLDKKGEEWLKTHKVSDEN